jgi:hypothetical protein
MPSFKGLAQQTPEEVRGSGEVPVDASEAVVASGVMGGERRFRRCDPDTPGTLEEPQVRAMFDRIAGIYDR